jgi:hypothetical protein
MAERTGRPTYEPDSPEHEDEKIRRSRRDRNMLDPEDAPLAYVWRHYHKRCTTLDEAIEFLAKGGIETRDVALGGQLAWSVLEQRALEGDVKAAMFMVEKAIAAPDRPFSERLQSMSLNELQEEFREQAEGLGLPPSFIEQTLARGLERVGER